MLKSDLSDNKAIGRFGAEAITSFYNSEPSIEKFRLLTHCNTGSLATSGYGTALGIVRRLNELKRLGKYSSTTKNGITRKIQALFLPENVMFCILEHVYCTETRPYNQGARLTAYELVHHDLNATLIVDSAVAALFTSENRPHAVVVGADRVARNGDVANKIGTYQVPDRHEIFQSFGFQSTTFVISVGRIV